MLGTVIKEYRQPAFFVVVVITMRINHGEHLLKPFGCSSFELSLTDKSSPNLFTTLMGRGGRRGRGEGKKKKKGTKTKHQRH